jgi:8-oxo-dGTP diphosphatase
LRIAALAADFSFRHDTCLFKLSKSRRPVRHGLEMKNRATLICLRNGRVLLVAREKTKWSLPGGKAKSKEGFDRAAHRELKEETGLTRLKTDFQFCFAGRNARHHVFAVEVLTKHRARPSSEIRFCRWVAPSRLAKLPIGPDTRRIIERYLKL